MKDRRPSISPNFNFLGQLVEFDTELTKQRANNDFNSSSSSSLTTQTSQSADITQVNIEVPERAPSPSKRPCMFNLSRRSLGLCADVVTVQSPTTALSRLQFVEPRQTSSTAAVNVLPKSTTDDGLITQSSTAVQSKCKDTAAEVVQQHKKHVPPPLPSSSLPSQQTTNTTRGGEVLAVNIDKMKQATDSNSANKSTDMLPVLFDCQSSFKSRSLEDILLVSTITSPPRSLGHGQDHATSRWTPADQSHDESRLTRHGSLNTSHASLHGSREMIQVS